MISTRRLWAMGALLIGVGWLVTPSAVPIYDGIGVPDEPYRFVTRPAGTQPTADPTVGSAATPVTKGVGTNGLIVATSEQGPQFSLFVPPRSLAAQGGPIQVRVTPEAPADEPAGSRIAGNVYAVTVASAAGPVTTTAAIGGASLYLRAIDNTEGWLMQYRPSHTDSWQPEATSRSGTDTHVAVFKGPGEYALALPVVAKPKGGVPLVAWLLGGGVALLFLLVVSIRLRAAPE